MCIWSYDLYVFGNGPLLLHLLQNNVLITAGLTCLLGHGKGQSWAPTIKMSSDIWDNQYLTLYDQQLITTNDGRRLKTTTDAQTPHTRQSVTVDSRHHRVGSVLSFFSSRRNWDSPPSPLGVCAPPPWFGGGGTHSLAGEGLGMGESQFRRGDIHCGTLYVFCICTLLLTRDNQQLTHRHLTGENHKPTITQNWQHIYGTIYINEVHTVS